MSKPRKIKPQGSKHERSRRKQLTYAKSQGGWGKARPATAAKGCPVPQKRRWGTQEAAEREMPEGREAYRCPCGQWHHRTKR